MILILGGTGDARELARRLRDDGLECCLHTLTQFGSELASDDAHTEFGEFNEESFRSELKDYRLVVDATHPFATRISTLAMRGCADLRLPYLRFERAATLLPSWVTLAHSHHDAAERAIELSRGKRIFLAVGSRELRSYVHSFRAARADFVARVLPTSASLLDCEEAGLSPSEIIAMFGVPEEKMELSLLNHFDVGAVVTKESGSAGGIEEKLRAAHKHGAAIIVVVRPPMVYPWVSSDMDAVVAKARGSIS